MSETGTDVMIFKIFSQKIGVFDSKQSLIIQKFGHDIGF
jgi:hypothetical protein